MKAFWIVVALASGAAALAPASTYAGNPGSALVHQAAPVADEAAAEAVESQTPSTLRLDAESVVEAAAQAQASSSSIASTHSDLLTGLLIALGCALFSLMLRRLPSH